MARLLASPSSLESLSDLVGVLKSVLPVFDDELGQVFQRKLN
jgi:hypothetical protein